MARQSGEPWRPYTSTLPAAASLRQGVTHHGREQWQVQLHSPNQPGLVAVSRVLCGESIGLWPAAIICAPVVRDTVTQAQRMVLCQP
jgi:hypothetical protein